MDLPVYSIYVTPKLLLYLKHSARTKHNHDVFLDIAGTRNLSIGCTKAELFMITLGSGALKLIKRHRPHRHLCLFQ